MMDGGNDFTHPTQTTSEEAKRRYEILHDDPLLKKGLYEIFATKCRNCYFSGIGYDFVPNHTVLECKLAGASCFMDCRICDDGSMHWVDNCPNKKAGRTLVGCYTKKRLVNQPACPPVLTKKMDSDHVLRSQSLVGTAPSDQSGRTDQNSSGSEEAVDEPYHEDDVIVDEGAEVVEEAPRLV